MFLIIHYDSELCSQFLGVECFGDELALSSWNEHKFVV